MARRNADPAIDVAAAKDPAVPKELRGGKPKKSRRVRGVIFGDSGVGKTWACLTALPRPYVIDTEGGSNHYGHLIEDAGGAILHTHDIDEVCDELRKLIRYEHPYRTVVIDPLTILYDEALAVGERLVGTSFSAHYTYANRRMKEMMTLMSRLDMHVFATSHEKDQWTDGKVEGKGMDGWKRTKYAFDLVLHMRKLGNRRTVTVVKTRLDGFPDGDTFEWSADELGFRVGDGWNAVAERGDIADVESVSKLQGLIAGQAVDPDAVASWLKKAKVDALTDLPAGIVAKLIDHLSTNPAEMK